MSDKMPELPPLIYDDVTLYTEEQMHAYARQYAQQWRDDAERYRWLRDIDADGWPAVRVPCPCPDGIPYPRCTVAHTTPMRGDALDAAIDAARAAREGDRG